jgi:Dyp-type peroxidase family
MTRLNFCDIQGFVARGFNYPYALFVLMEVVETKGGRRFVGCVAEQITNAEIWGERKAKPDSTVSIGFTYNGLERLGLSEVSLQSFPNEFVQGMKARGAILGDRGINAAEKWEEVWKQRAVHIWLGVYGTTEEEIEKRSTWIDRLVNETGGARVLQRQPAGALFIDGKQTSKEHFGYTDGFGNPDFEGVVRDTIPGQGKLAEDGKSWVPLATGEFLLGYPDEAKELPVSPAPFLLGRNGTFMVYRKLHQNVAHFRRFLRESGPQYGETEQLAAKVVGRWRDGTPLELSPCNPDPQLVGDKHKNTNFTYSGDSIGTKCPVSAHIRRTYPRDSFGFNGNLVNRRRIMRRGIPYGPYTPEENDVDDTAEHGIVFMALGASLFRQFEFVQQQWVEYGNDAGQGSDRDALIGNHGGTGKFIIPVAPESPQPPFVCGSLSNFVELRGGDYFFLPSLTALRMIAQGSVDPR